MLFNEMATGSWHLVTGILKEFYEFRNFNNIIRCIVCCTFDCLHCSCSFFKEKQTNMNYINWRVLNVEKTDIVENVYCCTTSTGSFALSDNSLSLFELNHNNLACLACNSSNFLFKEIYLSYFTLNSCTLSLCGCKAKLSSKII